MGKILESDEVIDVDHLVCVMFPCWVGGITPEDYSGQMDANAYSK